jgi:SpoVK/Ycf46/Vps4 family AAA+-type ATPase
MSKSRWKWISKFFLAAFQIILVILFFIFVIAAIANKDYIQALILCFLIALVAPRSSGLLWSVAPIELGLLTKSFIVGSLFIITLLLSTGYPVALNESQKLQWKSEAEVNQTPRVLKTKEEAEQRAKEYIAPFPEWDVVSAQDNPSDSKNNKWYIVDYVRYMADAKRYYFGGRIVLNSADGTRLSDTQKLKQFYAQNGYEEEPTEIDRETKAYELSAPLKAEVTTKQSVVLVTFIAPFIWFTVKKKGFRIGPIDLVFGVASLIQFLIMLYIILFTRDQFNAIFLITSLIGTATSWVTIKVNLKPSLESSSQDIKIIKPGELPNFSKVGGMQKVKDELKRTVGFIVSQNKTAQQYDINFNGVLLFGPPGVGKTYLAQATAGEFNLNFMSIKVSDLLSMWYGQSANNVQDIFNKALKNAPCLLFFDEFDSVAGERGEVTTGEESTRVVNQLLRSLEEVRRHRGKVIVFAATNNKSDLDEAVIRSGRFDKHIYIPLPDKDARISILINKLKGKPTDRNINIPLLSDKTEGMSSADITSLVDKAILNLFDNISTGDANVGLLDQKQLLNAVENFRDRQKPNIKKLDWNDLILQPEIISELKRLVHLIENPDVTQTLGIDPPKGILLYGPPGTGKTTIAKVIANQANASFFPITQADIMSKWVGESEKNIKKIFEEARKYKPSIIFIDEIDAIVGKRGDGDTYGDKTVNQILQEIDGVQDMNFVFIIGATNNPKKIDPALLRGGRLSTQLEIPLPGTVELTRLYSLFLRKATLSKTFAIEKIAALSHGYSGADVKEICNRALLDSLSKDGPQTSELTQERIEEAIKTYKKNAQVYQVPEFISSSGRYIQSSIQDIARDARPSVVIIFNKDEKGKMKSLGSGIVINESGLIATNFHVVENASSLEIELIDGTICTVMKIMGINIKKDIALLQIESDTKLVPAKLGDSEKLSIGEKVVAIGNPNGLSYTVSDGIISSFRIMEGNKLIQITAPISSGSSGGPIFNMKQEVIGISVAVMKEGQNLNFAIPSNILKSLLSQKKELPFTSLQVK